MRELVLKSRTTRNVKQVVAAVAWATNRRGRIVWKDDNNVASKLVKYLDEHNIYLPSTSEISSKQVKYTLERLVAEGWGWVKYGDRATVVEFGFYDDVNINGFEPLRSDDPIGLARAGFMPIVSTGVEIVDVGASAAPTTAPITPPLPVIKRPRFKATEITTLLDQWAEKDPDAYADWADRLVSTLEVIVND